MLGQNQAISFLHAPMQTTLVLFAFVTLVHAGIIPSFSPKPPPLTAREAPDNVTLTTLLGVNLTLPNLELGFHYNDTVAWRVYIAFLVLGIIMAVLLSIFAVSPDMLNWYRYMQTRKEVNQRKVDVEVATAKMREMLQQPESAHLPRERFG